MCSYSTCNKTPPGLKVKNKKYTADYPIMTAEDCSKQCNDKRNVIIFHGLGDKHHYIMKVENPVINLILLQLRDIRLIVSCTQMIQIIIHLRIYLIILLIVIRVGTVILNHH